MAEKDRFRKKNFKVQLTAEEYEILEKNVLALDTTKSDFVRKIILYGRLTQNVSSMDDATAKVFEEMICEMKRVGNDINQIAHNCNEKLEVSEDDIAQLKELLLGLCQRMVDALKEIDIHEKTKKRKGLP